jgi:hypothetical protein
MSPYLYPSFFFHHLYLILCHLYEANAFIFLFVPIIVFPIDAQFGKIYEQLIYLYKILVVAR